MSKKPSKYSLLQKNENDESEMIELAEFKQGQPTNKAEVNLALQYVQLEDENTTTLAAEQKPKTKPKPQNNSNTQQEQQNVQKKIYQERQSLYNQPMYSANPRQTRINLNGVHTRIQNGPPIQQPKFPEMKVACTYCTVEQMVPATTQVYVCCCCNNMCQCYPLYGLIHCGRCQIKVCYPYGTSEMIRCIRCNAINKVESEPRIPEQRQIQKSKLETETHTQPRSKPLHEDFFKEDEIVIEEEFEPVRPNNEEIFKEEEIIFDDGSLTKKNEVEEFKYPGV